MPQLVAVAYAAFEENFTSGADEARRKVWRYLARREVLAVLPDDGSPFGPDPAMLASLGLADDDYTPGVAPMIPPGGG